MLLFVELGKPEYPEKNLSEQGRKPTTNSTHICHRHCGQVLGGGGGGDSNHRRALINPGHKKIGGGGVVKKTVVLVRSSYALPKLQ